MKSGEWFNLRTAFVSWSAFASAGIDEASGVRDNDWGGLKISVTCSLTRVLKLVLRRECTTEWHSCSGDHTREGTRARLRSPRGSREAVIDSPNLKEASSARTEKTENTRTRTQKPPLGSHLLQACSPGLGDQEQVFLTRLISARHFAAVTLLCLDATRRREESELSLRTRRETLPMFALGVWSVFPIHAPAVRIVVLPQFPWSFVRWKLPRNWADWTRLHKNLSLRRLTSVRPSRWPSSLRRTNI